MSAAHAPAETDICHKLCTFRGVKGFSAFTLFMICINSNIIHRANIPPKYKNKNEGIILMKYQLSLTRTNHGIKKNRMSVETIAAYKMPRTQLIVMFEGFFILATYIKVV
jgi:hypothetical protein